MAEPKPTEPLVLTVNAIFDGKFIRAGDALPFTSEADLPLAMRPFIATGDETPFDPSERDIYADLPRGTRRQVRRLEMQAAHQEFAEQVASEPLREDVQAALQAEHDLRIGAALAQAECNQDAVDRLHEQLEAAAEPPQLFVKRGGEWGRVQNAKLKPGEHVFVRRENGEMESVGVINSRGEPPPQEIIP